MLNDNEVLQNLLERYDYGGAYTLLVNMKLEHSDVAILTRSCRYAINFDFESARHILNKISDETKSMSEYAELNKNLLALIDGESEAVFSELMENLKIKLINDEYIDFLGRVYRFKEAVFKYMFVKKHIDRRKFTLKIDMMSKRSQLKVLRKKYKIFNNNIVYALTIYMNKYQKDDYKMMEIVKILNSERMTELIELRNESIVGHGFTGVSRTDIGRVYGNPYSVLDDFSACLEKLEIDLSRYKYSEINSFILKLASTVRTEVYYSDTAKFE
ncbi:MULTISPECIES: hypothetical protein [unclassified Fusibacter]|uniref:hypothetical protein n=1 Tax=unclassified Fusibacter TaxID=2624464 RepID=UPI0010105774|nr:MULTISPECIES: hypothetical protein [unclassified Fusibacter]MCK8060979.1 hypothetical protein [Fusibacter sp. A2]NPE20567.1 hypothetical protein [Fusibacter sp. A1]RXV63764.1 hypothetical protein DWB64_01950 [Fusibacter sp. A1]